jgi:nicotinamide-nucleotide amidase
LRWAFYPGRGGVDVQLHSQAPGPVFDATCAEARRLLGHWIYTEEPVTSLAEVVRGLLVERRLTLAVAESCTGGLLGARLTAVPGASAYFTGGFVTYDDAAKRGWLGVPAELLEKEGAVSAAVAAAMARAARERAGAHRGLGITGIAGPSGGTAVKPVGLVFLALATREAAWTRRVQLGTDRDTNREIACTLALDMLRRHELGLEVGEPV